VYNHKFTNLLRKDTSDKFKILNFFPDTIWLGNCAMFQKVVLPSSFLVSSIIELTLSSTVEQPANEVACIKIFRIKTVSLALLSKVTIFIEFEYAHSASEPGILLLFIINAELKSFAKLSHFFEIRTVLKGKQMSYLTYFEVFIEYELVLFAKSSEVNLSCFEFLNQIISLFCMRNKVIQWPIKLFLYQFKFSFIHRCKVTSVNAPKLKLGLKTFIFVWIWILSTISDKINHQLKIMWIPTNKISIFLIFL